MPFIRGPQDIIKKLLMSPMASFVSLLISKWYMMIAIPSLMVVFWVAKGLEGAGILSAWQTIVEKSLVDAKSIARYCIPKIQNINNFLDCVEHPPQYSPTEEEVNLETLIKKNSVTGESDNQKKSQKQIKKPHVTNYDAENPYND